MATGTTFYPNTPQGRNAAAVFGVNTLNDDPADDDPYGQWLTSPVGQKWNQAQEAAAAQARKVADDEMERAHQSLKLQAQQIAISKGTAAANAWYQQQEAKLAQKRLDQEWKIHQDEQGLKQQAQNLDYAKAYTTYAQTPDQRFAASDFADATARLGQGLGVRPYGTTAGDPTPKTFAGFTALAGINPTTSTVSGAGYTPPAGSVDAMSAVPGGGSSSGGSSSGATGATTDPRLTAASAVMKAIPPSDSDGHDTSDQAALSAIQNIYKASRPGSYQRLLPGQQATFAAGLSRLGYYAPDAIAQMKRNGIGQGSVAAA